MKLHLDVAGGNTIRTHATGRIQVNDAVFTRSLIVLPNQIISDWPPQSFAELAAAHFAQIAACEPEIVILGTGSTQRFPAPQLTRDLVEQGIGWEVMGTPAACRTYNILMGDGRKVAAAIIVE